MQSKGTPGKLVTIAVTANQTFTDGSSGSIDNARFGVTTAVNWSNDMLFFLYAVMDDTEALIAFMIGRKHYRTASPASTSISKSGSIINVDENDWYSLASVTLTSYDSNPAIMLGSFRMTFAGATDSYTVTALDTTDGIGRFQQLTRFSMPAAQLGTTTGKYFLANGGTAPRFISQESYYFMRADGWINYTFIGGAADIAGAGAVALTPAIPFLSTNLNGSHIMGSGYIIQGGIADFIAFVPGTTSQNTLVPYVGPTASGASLNNADISLNTIIKMCMDYPT
jgi:hypothetical protein